jgi:crotonobetainyl-CoA:carnitine CoA-transferase CaiB-like acyl-CoA transferase
VTGPLAGIRVADFGQVVSGPMAGLWLADQGADVLKIEGPEGDPMRYLGPGREEMSAIYIAVNRGKRCEVLDLQNPESRPRLTEIIAWADVLIENFRPGVPERLGLGWEEARAINPRLIYCAISGYGDDGPYATLRVYDPIVQATTGLAAAQGAAAGQPMLMGTLVADKTTALTAAQAITAALYHRERTGDGQKIEVTMLDATLAWAWPDSMWADSFTDGHGANFPAYAALNRPWPAKDGFVVIGAMQHREGDALMRALGLDVLAADPRYATPAERRSNMREWMAAIAARIAEHDVETLRAAFIREGAVGAVVNDARSLGADPQIVHRGCVVEVEQPGVGTLRAPRHPARFSATPAHDPRPAPRLRG